MKSAQLMTVGDIDRWLASRGLRLGAGILERVYVATLVEGWGSGCPATCRATGATFSESVGRVMALWEREHGERAPESGPRGIV